MEPPASAVLTCCGIGSSSTVKWRRMFQCRDVPLAMVLAVLCAVEGTGSLGYNLSYDHAAVALNIALVSEAPPDPASILRLAV